MILEYTSHSKNHEFVSSCKMKRFPYRPVVYEEVSEFSFRLHFRKVKAGKKSSTRNLNSILMADFKMQEKICGSSHLVLFHNHLKSENSQSYDAKVEGFHAL